MFSHSDHAAQPWGGLRAYFSEAFRPTETEKISKFQRFKNFKF